MRSSALSPPDTRDRPALGILLMLGFCILAPLADGIAKLIGDRIPLLQLVTVRFVVQAALLVPLVAFLGLSLRARPRLMALLFLRTLLHIAGIALIFLALRYLPLADAIAIAYVMPFFVLLLGWLTLGEAVGWRRLTACIVGFAGTLMVVQPSFAAMGAVALLPLAVAVIFALFMLLTRHVAGQIGALELQAINGVMGAFLLLPLLVIAEGTGWSEADPVRPTQALIWLLLTLGVLGTVAHLVLTWALRFAPASTLAPVQYLEIPLAAVVGWLLFAEFPNGLALLGIAVVMGAGLYIVFREQAMASAAQTEQP